MLSPQVRVTRYRGLCMCIVERHDAHTMHNASIVWKKSVENEAVCEKLVKCENVLENPYNIVDDVLVSALHTYSAFHPHSRLHLSEYWP